MEDAKLLMPVKFTDTDGSWAWPKNERNEAYSPNWMPIWVDELPAIVALSCWTTWAARTEPSIARTGSEAL